MLRQPSHFIIILWNDLAGSTLATYRESTTGALYRTTFPGTRWLGSAVTMILTFVFLLDSCLRLSRCWAQHGLLFVLYDLQGTSTHLKMSCLKRPRSLCQSVHIWSRSQKLKKYASTARLVPQYKLLTSYTVSLLCRKTKYFTSL